jgi:hypothetical protein
MASYFKMNRKERAYVLGHPPIEYQSTGAGLEVVELDVVLHQVQHLELVSQEQSVLYVTTLGYGQAN